MDSTTWKRAKRDLPRGAGEERARAERVRGFGLRSEDRELRAQVQALLNAHDEAGEFLASPTVPEADEAARVATTLGSSPPTERPASTIGPYKLLQVIGEGGFGVVYMAEQEEPVRRRVALKIIKLGMDTKQVIARFEAERQALALMEHPKHRPGARRRGHRGGSALLRDGAGQGHTDHGVLRHERIWRPGSA